jgi:hypothetical protein
LPFDDLADYRLGWDLLLVRAGKSERARLALLSGGDFGGGFLTRIGGSLRDLGLLRGWLFGTLSGCAEIREHQRVVALEDQMVFGTHGGVGSLVDLAELLNDPSLAAINRNGRQVYNAAGRARPYLDHRGTW